MSSSPPTGRGALSNPDNRYDRIRRRREADGWDSAGESESSRIDTEITPDHARTVISRNRSPDVPFDQSINPYRGCEHGCIYCFARPTHAWLGFSPGLDFESRLTYKPDAAAQLRKELAKPGYVCRPIALGTNTDPYQPAERAHRVTRAILEVLADCHHPVSIVTKSGLVTRDLDLLAPMAARGLATVHVSLTTLDPALKRSLEPRAASPNRRLETLSALAGAGIPCGTLIAPVIPGINDGELEALLAAARSAGARDAGWILLRLPLEVLPLFTEWLRAHYPDRADRVLNLVADCHGGKHYDPAYGRRMRGRGPIPALLERRFRLASRRLGFQRLPEPVTSLFRAPGEGAGQLRLL
jgi:DNA repair photolyase